MGFFARRYRRPYSDLSDAEKSLQLTNETLRDEIEDWDEIVLTELPLFAKNVEDASEWVLYLINEETPGYTTSDETERKMNDILERPFMCRTKTRSSNGFVRNSIPNEVTPDSEIVECRR